MKSSLILGSFIVLSLVACTVTNNGPASGAGSGSGSSGDGGGGGASASSEGGAGSNADGGGGTTGSGGGASNVVVSAKAANITFGACPAASACGGDVSGTWDYTGGCLADPFAVVRQQCPTATDKNVTGTVVGTVNFVGNEVYRNAKASWSGTVTLPPECTMGASCAVVEKAIASAGDSVSCTGTSSCDCTITGHTTVVDATTFTTSGGTLTTASGGTYDFCVQGAGLTERETDSNAAEPGSFTLTKR